MRKKRTVVTGAVALVAVAALGACSNSGTKEAAPSSGLSSISSSAASEAAPHNKADMRFAHMMIPHHEQAIEMSDIILAKTGIDPRVVDLATQIKAAQDPEIEQMQAWLTQWGAPMSGMPAMSDMPGMDHGGMHGSGPESGSATTTPMPSGAMMPGMDGDMGDMGGMEGMMSPADMDALTDAQGVEASKLFLTGMIKHHQGALTMAQDEIKNGQFPDAIAMARSILESQQKEIDTMKEILASL